MLNDYAYQGDSMIENTDGNSLKGELLKMSKSTAAMYRSFCRHEKCSKAGDRIRTGDVQLGKLTFYH
jgi:hypothetical protein